jgi:hypothetical protein
MAAFALAAFAMVPEAFASAPPRPSPGAAPRVLNIVRTKVKPGTSGPYAALEAQIARAYERAKARVYWICLQSPKDATDVLYLNLHETAEGADRMAAVYRETVKQHPEIVPLQDRLAELTASTSSTLTTRREDVDRASPGVDFATMRALRLTTFEVRQGREGDFLKAIRTSNTKEGIWYVYEANDSSTFALITIKRTRINRRDGPAVPRTLRRFKGVYTAMESKTFNVRPAMSHVSQEFVAANPQLWRTSAGNH